MFPGFFLALLYLGWPLEWTEIIIIFVPIFLPMLRHFDIDPVLWGVLVFVNLQAAFLWPPVAMSAYYLKGVSPPHVTLNQIFAGMMPYMLIVILCMVIMYVWPGMVLGFRTISMAKRDCRLRSLQQPSCVSTALPRPGFNAATRCPAEPSRRDSRYHREA